MTQIGVSLDYPTNYDATWALPCQITDDSQYLVFGQPEQMGMVIDCEFLAPMLTPILAGQIHVVSCKENFTKAIYEEPRYYTTPPQKHTRCAEGRTCGDVVVEAEAPELFQYTVEDHSIPVKEDQCGAGGCGTHPKDSEMLSKAKYVETQMSTFQTIIDARFMKYIYSPVSDNLAVATATYPTITLTKGGVGVDVVDYMAINADPVNNITSLLADANLAMGYDDSIIPTVINATALADECICCLDADGVFRLTGYLKSLVGDTFREMPSDGDIIMIANYADIPYETLQSFEVSNYVGTTLAQPFYQSGLKPDMVKSDHAVYKIGGVMLILSYMAPVGQVLVLPKQVRDNINFAQSPFDTRMNEPSGCDYEGYHLAKKAFGWFIPSCYRDKYYIIDMTGLEDCCKATPCEQPI